MTSLIECIRNFSEARRPEVIDQIVVAINFVEGARLLDRSSDLHHNRTVLTFAWMRYVKFCSPNLTSKNLLL